MSSSLDSLLLGQIRNLFLSTTINSRTSIRAKRHYVIRRHASLSSFRRILQLKFIRRQVIRLLHALDKLVLFETSLALDAPIRKNLLELLDAQLGNILGFHFFRLDGKPHGTDFWVALVDSLAHLEGRHAQRKRLRDIALDGINVVADLFLAGRQRFRAVAAVVAHGLFNGGLALQVSLGHGGANVVHDFDTDWRIGERERVRKWRLV